MPLTQPQIDQLADLNIRVNAIPYDASLGLDEPPDYYTDKPEAGRSWVCRMYTQMKATQLRDVGWNPLWLTEFVVWTEPAPTDRELHAVLAVQAPDMLDPMILDSRFPQIYFKWEPAADYIWEARQVAGDIRFEMIA